MKILYVASKYDYGIPERGFSFEHYNFFNSLYNMGNEIIYFDYMDILSKLGKRHMNDLLLETFHVEKPELMFVFLSEYELYPQVISQISKSGRLVTVNWFADDHWRFDNYSRFCAPHFNWVVTTDADAITKYHAVGCRNVVLSQWACNHFLYKKLDLKPVHEVSFIGQAYGNRQAIIEKIRKCGVNVITHGQGWPSGRINQEQMVKIINRSRVNLNLANSSVKYASSWVNLVDRYALYTPGIKRVWRKLRSSLPASIANLQQISQIKGRNFEVPGCGGFLLTDYVKGLDEYYLPDVDIVCYNSFDELMEKVNYYLVRDELRESIALQGWRTTLDRHTYVHRFRSIFEQMGLEFRFPFDPIPGNCLEVSGLL